MSRIDEITQAAVKQIMNSWPEWSEDGDSAATVAQCGEAWDDTVSAHLTRVIRYAVEEAAGIGQAIDAKPEPAEDPAKCWCLACVRERKESLCGLPYEVGCMILCSTCGNKRCPHATDHRHACTKSNRPGQPGSVY